MCYNQNKIIVLHLIRSLSGRGGTPRKLLGLIKNSKNVKHIIHMFDNRHRYTHGVTVVNELREAGAIIEETHRKKSYDLRYLFDIFRLCKIYNPNIINTHFPRSDIFGALMSFFINIPVIKSVHGIPYTESPFVRWLDRFISAQRCLTVANSRATLNEELIRTKSKKTKVIYNGVEKREPSFQKNNKNLRDEFQIPFDSFLIGHIGGLTPWRDQITLVKAIRELQKKNIFCYCVIIGDGTEKRKIADKIKTLKLEKYVKLVGQRDDIGNCLNDIDAYVNPAIKEGFGIAVVEAMLADIPVILANSGALPELIENEKYGLLFSPSDHIELSRCIEKLNSSKDLSNYLSKEGKSHAIEKFSMLEFANEWEKTYQRFAKKKQ